MNRNLALILVLFFTVSLYSEGTPPAGEGTALYPYLIESLDNLLWLSSEDIYWSAYYRQTTDIEASETAVWNDGAGFEPIGDEFHFFSGTYDGDGFSISNLTINRSDTDYTGFFYTLDHGEVCNLQLDYVTIIGNDYTGGIAGENHVGLIDNCTISGSISGGVNVGSISGFNSTIADVSYCVSTCHISGGYNVGGISGSNQLSEIVYCTFNGTIDSSSQTGGIVGETEEASHIFNCTVSADISGRNYVGAIVGKNSESIITGCESSGNVQGQHHVAGICGGDVYTYTQASINNCFSTCAISGIENIGGIAGINYSNIYNSNFEGIVSGVSSAGGISGFEKGRINYCYALGEINSGSYAGGLVGKTYRYNGSIENSYFSGTVNAVHAGGLIGNYSESIFPFMENCFYNNDEVLVNNEHKLTLGALDSEIFNDWINNDRNLYIEQYFDFEEESYIISSVQDFINLSAFAYSDEYQFRLTNDLDLADFPGFFLPYFAGRFWGDSHIISNFYLHDEDLSVLGLFGTMFGSGISDLQLINADVLGYSNVGALAGNTRSNISHCSTSGSVAAISSYAGGLVAWAGGLQTIDYCYSTTLVTCNGRYNAGGLIGCANGFISNCYSTGGARGTQRVGGLVGYFYGDEIKNCYSSAVAQGESEVGGLAGSLCDSRISDSYCTGFVTGEEYVGGLVGNTYQNDFPYGHCDLLHLFWDTETTGQTCGIGDDTYVAYQIISGKTTEEMLQLDSYIEEGWDFVEETANGIEDFWDIDSSINSGYPFLTGIAVVDNDNDEIVSINTPLKAYPNPFNPELTIEFYLAKSEKVKIAVYNIKGQKVALLKNEFLNSGNHTIVWQPESLASGIYYLLYDKQSGREIHKVILLK